VVGDGLWKAGRFLDLLFRVQEIDACTEAFGPFEPPADPAELPDFDLGIALESLRTFAALLPTRLLFGEDAIEEELCGLRFRVSPNAFLQTNTAMAEKLYALAREAAQLTGIETVWDLYCGIGTIGLSLAADALTVWGIEWGYGTIQRGDSCVLRDVKVTLNVAVTLPRWKPPATATAQVVRTWQAYFKAVRLHEAGHRTIAERNAREVMAALTTLRGTNCDKLLGEASNTVERIVADGRARNRAYDVQTQHGQTQGVELGP